MIIITGAAGFIASCLVRKLNDENFNDLILVDDFSKISKEKNIANKKYHALVDRNHFFDFVKNNHRFIEFVFHIGARTDTTEFDVNIFNELNLNFTKETWKLCVDFGLPLIYASSAATYGNGALGYKDDESMVANLKPLNPYGDSKNDFDKWALSQEKKPYYWCGLKFFNVYGPNEYHKNRMASVIFHAYHQIQKTGSMSLFRSHKSEYKDGEQLRDFVYVKDVVDVCYWLMHHRKNSGIYNLGSGNSRTFNDLVKNTFSALCKTEKINYVDTPADIRDTYQYYTQANMNKLRQIGYTKPFTSLEEGINDYVKNYLLEEKYY